MKLDTGSWSTEFQKEFMSNVAKVTGLEYTTGIFLADKRRGIFFSKSVLYSRWKKHRSVASPLCDWIETISHRFFHHV